MKRKYRISDVLCCFGSVVLAALFLSCSQITGPSITDGAIGNKALFSSSKDGIYWQYPYIGVVRTLVRNNQPGY
jgi:hypothetical protein